MKVIDLLNKIANGEEVPKKIKWGEMIFTYDEKDDNEVLRYYDGEYMEYLTDVCHLDTEIEIIEEPKKIEKMEEYQMLYPEGALREEEAGLQIEALVKKVNELIDYINDKENK